MRANPDRPSRRGRDALRSGVPGDTHDGFPCVRPDRPPRRGAGSPGGGLVGTALLGAMLAPRDALAFGPGAMGGLRTVALLVAVVPASAVVAGAIAAVRAARRESGNPLGAALGTGGAAWAVLVAACVLAEARGVAEATNLALAAAMYGVLPVGLGCAAIGAIAERFLRPRGPG